MSSLLILQLIYWPVAGLCILAIAWFVPGGWRDQRRKRKQEHRQAQRRARV